jgi:hypothetical protein
MVSGPGATLDGTIRGTHAGGCHRTVRVAGRRRKATETLRVSVRPRGHRALIQPEMRSYARYPYREPLWRSSGAVARTWVTRRLSLGTAGRRHRSLRGSVPGKVFLGKRKVAD